MVITPDMKKIYQILPALYIPAVILICLLTLLYVICLPAIEPVRPAPLLDDAITKAVRPAVDVMENNLIDLPSRRFAILTSR